MSTDLEVRFKNIYPGKYFLSFSKEDLNTYLKFRSWLPGEEVIDGIEKAGESNMNCVLRVRTNERSFIIKQARPWVEKYPQIDAPVERNAVETRYLGLMGEDVELKIQTPELIGSDTDNFILVINDLGGEPFSFLYEHNSKLTGEDCKSMMAYISRLHQLKPVNFPENMAMRVLNHEHIFHFPFIEDNGFKLDDIQSGLEGISWIYKRDKVLKQKIESLGKLYLGEGKALIHGDYYPGSWLKTELGFRVIDPEFSHIGHPEFDLGIMIAHLLMTGHSEEIIPAMSRYSSEQAVDNELIAGFAGTEILRRLLGVAQLPLKLNLENKKALLDQASDWILSGMIRHE
ncbi:MAG: phosphotransferase [Bacteroidetes bacterium]|nr:phosphotransferase [Bacteroidota bacterium]MDA1122265.1 phosphotransferase [Bacteroidota bacterium]